VEASCRVSCGASPKDENVGREDVEHFGWRAFVCCIEHDSFYSGDLLRQLLERRFLSSHCENPRPIANARLDDAAAYAAAAADRLLCRIVVCNQPCQRNILKHHCEQKLWREFRAKPLSSLAMFFQERRMYSSASNFLAVEARDMARTRPKTGRLNQGRSCRPTMAQAIPA